MFEFHPEWFIAGVFAGFFGSMITLIVRHVVERRRLRKQLQARWTQPQMNEVDHD